MIKTTIYVKTTFTGFHQWPDAPAEVAFLRDLHRHVFHVEVHVGVNHADRDVEFFMLKDQVNSIIRTMTLPELERDPRQSCEMLASRLMNDIEKIHGHVVMKVTVSEDNENGATVEK